MQNSNKIQSVIENCDVKTAFIKVVDFFDPNRGKNQKTNILDFSNLFIWNDRDINLYNVTKTRNMNSASQKRFDLILYEPPYNKTYITNATEASKTFHAVLNDRGVVIIKTTDFKANTPKLIGGYDLKFVMEINDFYLSDQLIYKYNFKNAGNTKKEPQNNAVDTIHFYFMIFRKNDKKDLITQK